MDTKKKSIAIKLSTRKSKNGFFQVRLKNGRFAWVTPDVLKSIQPKRKLPPYWQTDCII